MRVLRSFTGVTLSRTACLAAIAVCVGIYLIGCQPPSHYYANRNDFVNEAAELTVDYYLTYGRFPSQIEDLDEGCNPNESKPCFEGLKLVTADLKKGVIIFDSKTKRTDVFEVSPLIEKQSNPYRYTRFGWQKGKQIVAEGLENVVKFYANLCDASAEKWGNDGPCPEAVNSDFLSPESNRILSDLTGYRKAGRIYISQRNGSLKWIAELREEREGNEVIRIQKE